MTEFQRILQAYSVPDAEIKKAATEIHRDGQIVGMWEASVYLQCLEERRGRKSYHAAKVMQYLRTEQLAMEQRGVLV